MEIIESLTKKIILEMFKYYQSRNNKLVQIFYYDVVKY